jgi:hypothetical protein
MHMNTYYIYCAYSFNYKPVYFVNNLLPKVYCFERWDLSAVVDTFMASILPVIFWIHTTCWSWELIDIMWTATHSLIQAHHLSCG